MIREEILSKISDSGYDGITAKKLAELFGYTPRGIWKPLKELEKEDKIYMKQVKGLFRVFSTENRTEETSAKECDMTANKGMGGELQNLLIETIAKFSAGKVLDEVMPLVRQKCIDEFGMTPVVHDVKIGNRSSVKMKCELPPVFDKILAYSVNGNPVMMTGPAGTGKGFLARKVAEATGSEFFEVNAVKNEYGLTGFVDANSRFVRTPFYDACKAASEGKKAVFLFDEMDCSDPEVLKIFNEALSSFEFTFPNDEHLTFENLIILAACNTFGTGSDEIYCGQQLDASTLNRFVLIRVDYNRKIEMSIAKGDEELVDFIDSFRRQTEKHGMMCVVSYRNLSQIVSMYDVLPLKEVMKDCLIKSMSDDDLQNILSNMSDTDNIYYRACKGENVKWKPKQDEQIQLDLIA